MHQENIPTVSVCVITYNQEKYVRECLQSIIDQETDFAFDVVVGDDCSTDGTSSIVREFAKKYPKLIRPILHAEKVGGTNNLFSAHLAARGDYIAHLDGDDRMLVGKLQAQVDFFREHPECAIVAHDMQIIDQNSRVSQESFSSIPIPHISSLSDLVSRGCFFAHSSKMYRRSAMITLAREQSTVDFYFHIEHAASGPIGYIDRPLGQYRRAGTGISSSRTALRIDVLRAHLEAYEYALENGVAPAIVHAARLQFRYVNAMNCIRRGDFEGFRFIANIDSSDAANLGVREKLIFGARNWPKAIYFAAKLFDRLHGRKNAI